MSLPPASSATTALVRKKAPRTPKTTSRRLIPAAMAPESSSPTRKCFERGSSARRRVLREAEARGHGLPAEGRRARRLARQLLEQEGLDLRAPHVGQLLRQHGAQEEGQRQAALGVAQLGADRAAQVQQRL